MEFKFARSTEHLSVVARLCTYVQMEVSFQIFMTFRTFVIGLKDWLKRLSTKLVQRKNIGNMIIPRRKILTNFEISASSNVPSECISSRKSY